MYHNLKFFDFEVYPEWWCVSTSVEEENYPGGLYDNKFTKEDEKRIKDKMITYRSDIEGDVDKLRKDVCKGILCGYNIKGYDMKILKVILSGYSTYATYLASQIILEKITPDMPEWDYKCDRLKQLCRFGYQDAEGWQDLMDDDLKSLKDKESALGMDIRETSVPFDKKDLTEEEKQKIIFYNKHDVYACHVYYVTTKRSYIDTKVLLAKIYNLPLKTAYRNTNAGLACKVLEAEPTPNTTIIDPTITIRDEKLLNYFKENIPEDILNHLLTKQESKDFLLYENDVTIADGGLHSVYHLTDNKKEKAALYVESTDEYTMYNVDAASCYPSVMIYCDAKSRAIRNNRFEEIYNRRIKLKFTPKSELTKEDKEFIPAGKLIVNIIYGAMGNKLLALYDDYMRSKVCRVGQMILIALANKMYNKIPGIKIIQNNTDGVLVYAKRSDKDKIQELVDEFSAISHFVFEVEEDKNLWQLNVNNYIAIHPDDSVKNKGSSFLTDVYQQGYKIGPLNNYCIPKAIKEFYVGKVTNNYVNPMKHILNNKNVKDFVVTCTKGPTYDYMIQYNKDDVVELGRVARVIAVQDDKYGIVKKRGVNKRESKNRKIGDIKEDTCALCPEHALVVNDDLNNYSIDNGVLKHIDGKEWKIDYNYYIKELEKASDVVWYKMKNNEYGVTKEFNI